MSYPYKVDYNDHFETPLRAYEDILPLLDLVSPSSPSYAAGDPTKKQQNKKKRKRPRSASTDGHRLDHLLYDPYYCAGRAKSLLQSLGFTNTVHEKRDFYVDIAKGTVPDHHTFVTNPPYSEDHKERCIEYAVTKLRQDGTPFFLLMPNYVALKEYYKKSTCLRNGNEEADDIVYVIPPSPYEYDHPEGTGKEIPPFASLWFCGVGKDRMEESKQLYDSNASGSPKLACSLKELQGLGAVKGGNRPNSKKRRKMKQMMAAAASASGGARPKKKQKNVASNTQTQVSKDNGVGADSSKRKKKKKSKHRNSSGVRTKKRF